MIVVKYLWWYLVNCVENLKLEYLNIISNSKQNLLFVRHCLIYLLLAFKKEIKRERKRKKFISNRKQISINRTYWLLESQTTSNLQAQSWNLLNTSKAESSCKPQAHATGNTSCIWKPFQTCRLLGCAKWTLIGWAKRKRKKELVAWSNFWILIILIMLFVHPFQESTLFWIVRHHQ